jgi:hypothetical protein
LSEPLYVLPTEKKTGLPTGAGYFKSFAALEFSSDSSPDEVRIEMKPNERHPLCPRTENKQVLTKTAVRISIPKDDSRAEIFDELSRTPQAIVLNCNHGMTKSHTTKVINFPDAKTAERVLSDNKDATSPLYMAPEDDLFGDGVLTLMTANSKLINVKKIFRELQCSWIMAINYSHLRLKTEVGIEEVAAKLKRKNEAAGRARFFRVLNDDGACHSLISISRPASSDKQPPVK